MVKSFSRLVRELMGILNCFKIALEGKSFKSFSKDYFCLVCLIILNSQLLRSSFWLGLFY